MSRKIVIYGIGTLTSKLLVFLLLPIYTRVIDPTDYGYYDVLSTNVLLITSISFFEIWSGILRYFLEKKELRNKLIILRSIYKYLLFSTVIYILILYWLNQFVIEIKFWLESFLLGISYVLFNTTNCVCRGTNKNYDYVISGVISTFVSSILSIYFCVYMQFNVNFLILSTAIGYFISALYVEIKFKFYRMSLCYSVNKAISKKIFHFCFPLMINSVAYSCLTMYNKNFIFNYFGESESGYYAIANKFAALIAIATSIYQQAWQEESYIVYNNPNKFVLYKKNVEYFISLVGLAIPLIVLSIGVCFNWLIGEDYIGAYVLVPSAIWGGFFSTFSGVIGNILGAEKITKKIFTSTLLGGGINIFLVNSIGVHYGTIGINTIILLAFMIITLVRYWLVKNNAFFIDRKYIFLLLAEVVLSTWIYLSQNGLLFAISIVIFGIIFLLQNKQILFKYIPF